MSEEAVRADASILGEYVNKIVRVAGKIEQVKDNTAVLSSNGRVNLQLPPNIVMSENKAYEVTGKAVQNSGEPSLLVLDTVELGDAALFNEKTHEALVKYSQKFPELFAH